MLACGRGALLSHHSAPPGFGGFRRAQRPLPFQVDHAGGAPARPPTADPIPTHARPVLVTEDRAASAEGIPGERRCRAPSSTSPPRAGVGSAWTATPSSEAKSSGCCAAPGWEAAIGRAGGHHGAGALRRAIALYRPAPFTRLGLERRFAWRLVASRPACRDHPTNPPSKIGYELDAYWPAERFAVELDVFETHGTRAAFERDRLRQEELAAGIETIRVTGRRLEREPERVIERVGLLLARRRES